MDIERMGGLIKRMPHSALLFLLGSLAICGFPPFNGFISEFFIYNGLFKGLVSQDFSQILMLMFSIIGLVLIGGLALICFTKAFGIVFLGTPRDYEHSFSDIESPMRMIPMYLIGFVILLIGMFPVILSRPLFSAINQINPIDSTMGYQIAGIVGSLTSVGWYSLGFVMLVAIMYGIRHYFTKNRKASVNITWGCSYTGDASRMQYTASSFVRTYRKLAEPALSIQKEKVEAVGLYPEKVEQRTYPGDKIESALILKPVAFMRKVLNSFAFLQNGKVQVYLLYGVIFIALTILLPIIIENTSALLNFLNQL